MPEDHNCLVLTSYHVNVPKLRSRDHTRKSKSFFHCTESLTMILKYFSYLILKDLPNVFIIHEEINYFLPTFLKICPTK